MDVNRCYSIMKLAVAKNLEQGYLSPEDFFTSINTAQQQYLDYLLGRYQSYQLKRPISVVEFGQNERIRDSISPLIYNAILPINSTTGIASRPSDYEYTDAVWGVYGNYNIKFVQQDRLDSYIHSDIDPVASNPVYLIRQEGFQFYPDRPYGENQAKMSYVRTPPSIVWGYTTDSNGIPRYNPATSQDPVWSDTDMMEVIARALLLEGVSLQIGQVSQYADSLKQGGQ